MYSEQTYCRKRWSKVHRLIVNRVSCINQMHGCRYDFDSVNPCVLVCDGSHYRADYGGISLVSWRAYDLASAERALEYLDGFNEALWRISVAGYLVRMC